MMLSSDIRSVVMCVCVCVCVGYYRCWIYQF